MIYLVSKYIIQVYYMKKSLNVRKLVVCAMLSALASVLMFLEFSVPFMPAFLKFDFSELPALIGSFSLGPVWGVIVCLIKNLINLPHTGTGGVGELANFLIGASFVFVAGLIYSLHKTKKTAVIGSVTGSVIMAILSFPINLWITYPVYAKLMPIEQILSLYASIIPGVNSLPQCLFIFNVPFTLFKGLIASLITIIIYKKISPVIKGRS